MGPRRKIQGGLVKFLAAGLGLNDVAFGERKSVQTLTPSISSTTSISSIMSAVNPVNAVNNVNAVQHPRDRRRRTLPLSMISPKSSTSARVSATRRVVFYDAAWRRRSFDGVDGIDKIDGVDSGRN